MARQSGEPTEYERWRQAGEPCAYHDWHSYQQVSEARRREAAMTELSKFNQEEMNLDILRSYQQHDGIISIESEDDYFTLLETVQHVLKVEAPIVQDVLDAICKFEEDMELFYEDEDEDEEDNYSTFVSNKESQAFHFDSLPQGARQLHALLGMLTEVGEIADHIKRVLFYGTEFNQEYMELELGDLGWYKTLMENVLGVTEEQIKQKNVDKLNKRYKEKFTKEEAVERKDELQELIVGKTKVVTKYGELILNYMDIHEYTLEDIAVFSSADVKTRISIPASQFHKWEFING